MELNKEQLTKVNGGAITPTMINAVTKALNMIYEFGRQAGSYIRRLVGNKYCSLS